MGVRSDIKNHQSHEQGDHLPPAKHLVGSFADAVPGLPVPRLPGPGGDKDDDVGFHDDDNGGVDGCLPEKLVVDDDGVDEVEREEPEEETGDPAGQLMEMVLD